MYFIDSDILSYLITGDVFINDKLSHFKNTGEDIVISSITQYEIIKGLRWKNNKKIENAFNNFIKCCRIIPLENSAIGTAADIYSSLRRQGITIGDADIFIAATVIYNNGTLVTNNIEHFSRIQNLKLL